jgi:hypothetical protein
MGQNSYDAWLESPYHEDEDADELISDRVQELMKPGEDYDPYEYSNFSEAISNCNTDDAANIEEMLRSRNFEQLGRFLWSTSIDYYEKLAESVAADQYNQGLLSDYDE